MSGPSIERPTEIAADSFCIGPWGRTQTNVYLVRGESAWTLIDAGWASDAPRIEAAVRSVLGPSATPSAIVLTHAHPDHDGSARALAAAWNCVVFLHAAELGLATGDFATMERYAGPVDRWLILPAMRMIGTRRRSAMLARSSLVGVVRPLPPAGAVPGLDSWQWIATPGHTPGHVSLVRAADRVVISGDALVNLAVGSLSGLVLGRQELSGPPWYTTWDQDVAARSILAIAALEPALLAGGHGAPVRGRGTSAAVRAFATRIAGRPDAGANPA